MLCRAGGWLLLPFEIRSDFDFMSNDFSLSESRRSQATTDLTPSKTHPKFSQGDEVVWAKVSAHDHGVVCGCIWSNENPSCKTLWGWHYLVRLHPNSRSYSYCKQDWAYETDLQLLSEFNQGQAGGEAIG
jgi:hypothetical protein